VSRGLAAQAPTPQVRVAIIAPTAFEDKDLQDASLIKYVIEARDQLKTFFQVRYHVTPTIFSTHDDTTADFLRTWLFDDLLKDNSPAVHLVFLLTHGFADSSDPKRKPLFLATSDTSFAHPSHKSLRGDELLTAFKDLPPQSLLFLFVDACGSGAINSDALQMELNQNHNLAARVMILASSQPDEKSYGARLTRSLVRLWQQDKPACHSGRYTIETFLTNALRTIPGVSPDVKQTVRLVAPMCADFCIEAFNYTQRLVFLFNGAEGDITVTLGDGSADSHDELHMSRGELVPVPLQPKKYTVVARRQAVTNAAQPNSQVEVLDLEATPVAECLLFSSDPLDVVEAGLNAARVLEARGLFPSEVLRIRTANGNAGRVLQASLVVAKQIVARSRVSVQADLKSANARVTVASNELYVAELESFEAMTASGGSPFGYGVTSGTPPRLTAQQAEELARREGEARNRSVSAREDRDRLLANLQALQARDERLDNSDCRLVAALEGLAASSGRSAPLEALEGELKRHFAQVGVSNRGVTVDLPADTSIPANSVSAFRALIEIANRYAVRMQLEFLAEGGTALSQQTKARRKMTAFVKQLQSMGLKTSTIGRAEYHYGAKVRPRMIAILSVE
jgi:hypothetical protein